MHDKFRKWSRGRFFAWAQGKHFQYMKHCKNNIRIYVTTMIPLLGMVFITIVFFYYECCNLGKKKGARMWGGRQL